MTFETLFIILTLDSIRNSCDVLSKDDLKVQAWSPHYYDTPLNDRLNRYTLESSNLERLLIASPPLINFLWIFLARVLVDPLAGEQAGQEEEKWTHC